MSTDPLAHICTLSQHLAHCDSMSETWCEVSNLLLQAANQKLTDLKAHILRLRQQEAKIGTARQDAAHKHWSSR